MHGLGAWDSAAPSSIIADACCACSKAENRQKIKMAVKLWERRNRGGLTSQEERIGIIVFFREQTSISATAAADFGALMRHAESGWTGPWSTMMLAERVASCVDLAADLWGLLAAMKSGLRGGKGLCKNLSVCNLSHYHSATTFRCTLTCELYTKHGSDEMDIIAGKCARGQQHFGSRISLLWFILLHKEWKVEMSDQSESN